MLRKISKYGPREAHRATKAICAPFRWAYWWDQRPARKRRPTVRPKLPRRKCVTPQAVFLRAYRETASIPAAATAAGIEAAQHYQWLACKPAYAQDFADLQTDVIEALQDQAVERAMEGWVEPVLYRGRVCGTIQRHSNRLLWLMLKAFKPEKWGPARLG